LALTTREARPLRTHDGLNAFRQLRHEFLGAGEPQRLLDRPLAVIAVAERQVLEDASVKQDQLLRHVSHHRPPRLEIDLGEVDAVDQDSARQRSVQSQHEVDEGRLACA
jgi:hypothetical protein